MRRALEAASASAGLEVHVRPLDPPRVPDAEFLWDRAGEHKNCPQQLEVILRVDRAPGGRVSIDGGFVTWKWTDQVDLRGSGWQGDPYPDGRTWEVDLGDWASLTALRDDLQIALFAAGAQAGTRISFDLVHGAAPSAIAPDEDWVDGASAADLQTRVRALAEKRGGSVAVALTNRPGAAIRLQVQPRRDSLVVVGWLATDREGAAKALGAAGWRRGSDQRQFRRSWRRPKSGPAGVPSDRMFANLAQTLAALADESVGGAISVRLEAREAEVAWRGQGAEDPIGCVGWLLGSAGTLLACIALALAGFDFPAGLGDTLQEAGRFEYSTNKTESLGPFLALIFAWLASMVAAFATAGLVIWLADRVRARYDPTFLIAEVTAAVATVVFLVALGLVGDSWRLLAASLIVGTFVIALIDPVIYRLRRSAGPR
jgi:hypothetical protein